MANKFTVGMRNLVEVLNQMWDAFAAGPYNAVPLTGGTMTGPLVGTQGIFSGVGSAPESRNIASALLNVFSGPEPASGQKVLAAQLGVRGIPSVSFNGAWHMYTSSGPGYFHGDHTLTFVASDTSVGDSTVSPLTLSGNGRATVGGNLTVGNLLYCGPAPIAARHGLYKSGGISTEICWFGRDGTASPCVAVNGSDGAGGWGNGGSVLYVGKNNTTLRSINASGTINASGADYAEYLVKGPLCGTIAPGAVVGIDASGRLTDTWSLAISFAVKSTAPCIVGGDTWSNHLGARPEAPQAVAVAPAPPVRTLPSEDSPGETDAEWAEIQVLYAAALAAHQVQQQDYVTALAAYDLALVAYEAQLEAARQTVDRIAFAGQVPVNLQGAVPGQFIVPVQDGDGIAGVAVDESNITLRQYMRAIGRVIAIEDDGRARIIVKVA